MVREGASSVQLATRRNILMQMLHAAQVGDVQTITRMAMVLSEKEHRAVLTMAERVRDAMLCAIVLDKERESR